MKGMVSLSLFPSPTKDHVYSEVTLEVQAEQPSSNTARHLKLTSAPFLQSGSLYLPIQAT
jgi:hypothetical protein